MKTDPSVPLVSEPSGPRTPRQYSRFVQIGLGRRRVTHGTNTHPSTWARCLHAGRAVGGNCDYCHARRLTAAGGTESTRGRQPHRMPEQSPTNRPGHNKRRPSISPATASDGAIPEEFDASHNRAAHVLAASLPRTAKLAKCR